ncbi:MAG: peptidase M15 [Gammaproteobacteria bacterium]|nr:peptidase M15 [Gammaproteobacteria bacterium]
MIDRRTFIAAGAGLTATLFASSQARLRVTPPAASSAELATNSLPSTATSTQAIRRHYAPPIMDLHPDSMVLDQIASEPDVQVMPPDVILSPAQRIAFDSALARLRRLQKYVGHGNFNIIGWDQSLKIARSRDALGAFTHSELELIEELFFTDAKTLGFYGDKVVATLSASIAKRDIVKIPRSGHFLFKGSSTATFDKIRSDLGDSVVLTSGIRSVVKQIYLFMNKAEQVDGNLSLASFSLAPPGHSYHAVGDFDVGKKGFGRKNFSEAFAQTDEFKRLIDLGYLDIRYPQENPFGVRYEPWHIKVV